MTDPSVLPSSFRDPSGFVFRRDGGLYRQINSVHRDDYDALLSSGLYEELTGSRLLVAHEEVPWDAPEPEGAYKVIRPEVVDFISYPYEWSFGQLRDAALTTLSIQARALDKGMSLRDANAYNIQFHRGRPMLIDTLSFERLREGRPWIAYRQFCQHFLAPLALMSYRDVRLGQLLRVHIDGIPLDLAARLLPFRARLRIPLLLHIFMHARTQKRHAREAPDRLQTRSGRGFSIQAFKGLVDSLRSAIGKMRLRGPKSGWVDYYSEASHYTPEAMNQKKDVVGKFIARVSPSTVLDLGANTGLFSRMASDQKIKTVAVEMDAACVEENYRRVKEGSEENLLPLLMDFTNPSPAIGWGNEERMTLEQRGPADLVIALGLIHHLAIANNVPLANVADSFARLGRYAIVEFVPKSDEKVQHLLSTREDIFPTYTRHGFEKAFRTRFHIEDAEELEGSERVLFLLRSE